jgi:hypothetical protein
MWIHQGVNAVEGISDIRIIGIDEQRPPRIRKEPYIDVVFKLSHQAPVDWCNDFNSLMSKHASTPKIKPKEGIYIETWVRTPDAIIPLLDQLKLKVAECNQRYIDRIELSIRKAAAGNATLADEPGEQGRLNRIVAALNFDDVDV